MHRWELEQKIVLRALKDPAFKKKLLAQPKEALREFLKSEKGIDSTFLDRVTIRTIEEKEGEWIVALPHLPTMLGALSDEEVKRLVAAADTSFLCTLNCGAECLASGKSTY